MSDDPPVDFEALAKEPVKNGGGSPLQISSSSLMKNFVFATLIIEDGWALDATGKNGHATRKLLLPTPNTSGTYVLGTVDGQIVWIATESCT